jgi:hypothetical protein
MTIFEVSRFVQSKDFHAVLRRAEETSGVRDALQQGQNKSDPQK